MATAKPRAGETLTVTLELPELIPPLRNPMFKGDNPKTTDWHLTRTWYIFFQELGRRGALSFELEGEEPAAAASETSIRTLVLKDTTIGNDIADHVTAYMSGAAVRIVGVLRRDITSDLTVRVKKNGTAFITITIPSATALDTPVEASTFTPSTAITDGDVFSWDIVASDGLKDRNGVATFTLEWITIRQPVAAAVNCPVVLTVPLPTEVVIA